MIQLLYGNNGVNYAEIARSRNLSEEQYNELYKNHLGYSPVANPELYEGKEYEPVAYNILVTNLSGKLPNDMLLLSRKAKMRSYETPCYYAHLQLMDIGEELFKKKFIDLFKYDFIEEGEIKEYQGNLIEEFKREKTYGIDKGALRDDQIKACLYLLYQNMESWTKKVTIIIDQDGENYNERALNIVAGIYEYIPWSLRRLVGFTTYSTPDVKEAEQIKIRIMPRWYLSKCDEKEVLDFKSDNLMDSIAVKNVSERIRDFVDRLWEGKGKKEQWFRIWWRNYENSGDLGDHLGYGYKWKIWNKGDITEHFGEIMEYALDKNNERKGQYQIFIMIVGPRIKQKIYDEIVCRDLNEVRDINDFYKKIKDYALFANIFPDIQLKMTYATKWLKKKYIMEILKEQDLQMRFSKLMQLLKILNEWNWDFIPEELEEKWTNNVCKHARSLQDKINKERKMERDKIDKFIWSLQDNFYIIDIEENYKRIRYKEDNNQYFKQKLCYFLKTSIEENDMSFREEDYVKSGEWLQECQGIIDENDYNYLKKRQEEIAEKRKGREELLFIIWNTRDDIQRYYVHRTRIHLIYEIAEGMVDEDMKYILTINGEEFQLEEEEMDAVADYLINQTKDNRKKAEQVFEEKEGLHTELVKNGFLKRRDKIDKGIFSSRKKKEKRRKSN